MNGLTLSNYSVIDFLRKWEDAVGFRINKTLGYGFQNLSKNDPRIDWDQYEQASEAYLDEFNTYLRLMEDGNDIETSLYWRGEESKNLKSMMCQYVSFDSEFGIPEIMLFTHLGMPDWNRRNDAMDYYGSVLNNDYSMESSFKYIPFGIYPFEHGKMTYIPSGHKVKTDTIRLMRDQKLTIKMKNGDRLDFSQEDHIAKFAPPIPSMVRHLATFFGVKPEYLDTMQSGMYEYWS